MHTNKGFTNEMAANFSHENTPKGPDLAMKTSRLNVSPYK